MEDPDVTSEDATEQLPNPSQQDDDGNDEANRKKSNVRKRTKTGCLTCRKRRIKCDEGRPTCNNCIKSKRLCEGYSQRVIFKDPMGAIQGGPFGPALYPHGSSHFPGQLQSKSSLQGPLPLIAPKPTPYDYQGQQNVHFGQYGHGQPSISPTAYDFNQGPINHVHYPPPNSLVPPQAQGGYVEIDHSPHQHHFAMPPNAQASSSNGNAYATVPQAIPAEVPREITNEVTRPQVPTWDYELPDDDASMGESDDETGDPRELLGPVVQRFNGAWDSNGTRVRTFSAFAQNNVLSEYTASAQIGELRDPQILAIFMHFIKVTGPSMSLYERHPFDYGEDDQFMDPNPKGTSNLWSYTFPLVSFNHPGLLHAILALASLQIAKLQKVPATAAMRHYHLAIRRIAKNVRAPLRRTQPPTLAATLLLAYFEVWSSDHTKWCNHLFGARILFREIPLQQMTRKCLSAKLRKQRQKDAEEKNQITSFFPGFVSNGRTQLMELDYQLLSTIAGQPVIPDQYGLVDDQSVDLQPNSTTDRDIEQYENLRDLYWWYCKMDVYQSILGGTKLFMEYEFWTQCPPRAPISKLEAIYGTYDHLMLLLGRLANFSSTDLSRKRRANRGKTAPQGSNSPPQFPGMLPTHGKVKVPMGFSPPAQDGTPQSDLNDDVDPEASFQAALQDWEEIQQGFEAFQSHLGPEFQPLRPEYSDRRDSPFGMTLQYRTFSVAGIWMNYYMGMIHLYRTHPSMPPAAMQAAGLSARQTAGYAIQLGRIAAGLSDDCSQMTEISTMVSAAFIESCFCLFVAGVQYQADDQRHWLVRRMYDISRLTGWQSAKQIADGCESGWIKAAQLGRGPPYVRAPDVGADVSTSVWQNPRRIDRIIREHDGMGDDKRLVLAKSERAFYALGLIGVEHDLEVLELKDEG